MSLEDYLETVIEETLSELYKTIYIFKASVTDFRMRVFSILSISLAFLLILTVPAVAQSSWLVSLLDNQETAFEKRFQNGLRDFRLIKSVESFDERLNAVKVINIASDPNGAIATLHDLRTGEPLESCQTPCDIHVDGVNLI